MIRYFYRKFKIPLLLLSLLSLQCDFKPAADKLPLSVKENLRFLQKDPQFVMYLNFKNMRKTDFWKKHVSDSLLNAEKTFGSLLNMFKNATGASISNGLDELYYSNSWVGENAIVMKGIFDKEKLQSFIQSDSNFSVTKQEKGINVYSINENGLHFFFKDNFTLCASNYLSQLDNMMSIKENDTTGILLNGNLLKVIADIQHKENLWMVTTEKMFIRGVFLNFLSPGTGNSAAETDTLGNPLDTTIVEGPFEVGDLYKKVNSISFSALMKDELEFIVQAECIDVESAEYLASVTKGIIAFSKISTAIKDRKDSPSLKLLESINVKTYEREVFVNMTVTDYNIEDFRKAPIMQEPKP